MKIHVFVFNVVFGFGQLFLIQCEQIAGFKIDQQETGIRAVLKKAINML